jgi:hypothetical protein
MAPVFCALDVHHARLGGAVGQDFGVHALLDLGDLRGRDGRVVRKVEAGLVGIDQRALLLHVRPSTSRSALCIRCVTLWLRMVAARRAVHLRLHAVAHLQAAGLQRAVVAEHVGLDLDVSVTAERAPPAVIAPIAHLAAGFGVERGRPAPPRRSGRPSAP